MLQYVFRYLKKRTNVDPFSIHLLCMEIHLLLLRWKNRILIFRRKRLAKLKDIQLHFGCGKVILTDWVNIDGWSGSGVDVTWDLRQTLPFSNDSTKKIYTHHVIEHFPLDVGKNILREFYRILAPGGVVRIAVPDGEKYMRAYYENDINWLRQAGDGRKTPIDCVNFIFQEHFHRYIYDYDMLKICLENAGFDNVEKSSVQASTYPELRVDSVEPVKVVQSLYVEAYKPISGQSSENLGKGLRRYYGQ